MSESSLSLDSLDSSDISIDLDETKYDNTLSNCAICKDSPLFLIAM